MQVALEAAEGTAAAAARECGDLAAAVRRASAQDAASRRALAHRAHALRGALGEASAQLRAARAEDRLAHKQASREGGKG
jgi:hypothetical protein